jgi:hypothetical protein
MPVDRRQDRIEVEPKPGLRPRPQAYGSEIPLARIHLLAELEGEDLDRVLQAIAMVKHRRLAIEDLPADLWIRAAEPDE